MTLHCVRCKATQEQLPRGPCNWIPRMYIYYMHVCCFLVVDGDTGRLARVRATFTLLFSCHAAFTCSTSHRTPPIALQQYCMLCEPGVVHSVVCPAYSNHVLRTSYVFGHQHLAKTRRDEGNKGFRLVPRGEQQLNGKALASEHPSSSPVTITPEPTIFQRNTHRTV